MLSVTVEDLLHLALPAGTTVVGGKNGLGRDVAWAVSLRTFPSAFPSLKGGEIALLSVELLRQLEPPVSLSQMIPRLVERGVSALAVIGPVDTAAISAADEAGIPLLKLPQESSLSDLETTTIRAISERRAELYRQDSEVQQRLTELALRGRGLGAIVQLLADMSGRVAALEDNSAQVLHLCHPAEGFRSDLASETLSQALAGQARLLMAQAGLSGSESRAFSLSLSIPAGNLARLVMPVVIGGEQVGFLSLLAESEEWDHLDYLILTRAASSCALEMSKERAVNEAESRLRGDFITELMESPTLKEDAMLDRARRLGHDLTLPHTVVLWRLDGTERPPGSINENRLSAAARSIVLRSQVLTSRQPPLLHVKGGTIALICSVDGGVVPKSAVEQVRRTLGDELPGVTFSAGLGRPTTSARALRTAYQEAEQALAVAQRLLGGDCTSSFADLGVYRLLLPLHGSGELQSFYDEVLGLVEAYDRQNHTDLIPTLEAFFRCHGNQQLAAQELCLHRNTMAYRLRRIEEISGLSLDNLEDRFQLQLAVKIRRVI